MCKLQRGIQFVMCFTSYYTDGIETVVLPCGSRGVDVVRPGATECEQCVLLLFFGLNQVVLELAPLVTADMGVCQIFASDRNKNACFF